MSQQHVPGDGDSGITTSDVHELGRLLSVELKCATWLEGGKPIYTCKHKMRLLYHMAVTRDWPELRKIHEEAKKNGS